MTTLLRIGLTTLTTLALALGCSGSSHPVSHPDAPPARGAAVLPSAAALQELERPAILTDEDLARELELFARQTEISQIPTTPAVGEMGMDIVSAEADVPLEEGTVLSSRMFRLEPEVGAIGQEVRYHFRLLRRRPWVSLAADGTATVAFETVRPVAGSALYFGMDVDNEIIAVPRFRRSAMGAEQQGESLVHHMTAAVPTVITERYDVARARQSGRGVMHYRLELLDPVMGTSHSYEGELAFRCGEAGCGAEGATFVQLPTIQLGPVVDMVTGTSAVVAFNTDAATAAAILVVEEGGATRLLRGGAPGQHHEIEVSGLTPGQRYRYYALVVDRRGEATASRSATFRTSPPAHTEEPFTFIVMSDGRGGVGAGDVTYVGVNRQIIHGLLSRAMEVRPEFMLFVGDLVDGSATEAEDMRFQLESWTQVIEPFGAFVPIYEAMGNHEPIYRTWDTGWGLGRSGDESGEAVFASVFVNPQNGPEPTRQGAPPYSETVYSFDVASVHVAIINTNYWFRSHPSREDHPAFQLGQREGWVDDETMAWLESDLAAARERGARHLFVATHEPAFPCGGHARDAMYWHGQIPEVLERRDAFLRLLARHGVAALFHGDEHNYSRLLIDDTLVEGLERPVWHIITGSSGAPYYTQDMSLPWADQVRAFDVRYHMMVVTIEGDQARADAIAVSGALVDTVDLMGTD